MTAAIGFRMEDDAEWLLAMLTRGGWGFAQLFIHDATLEEVEQFERQAKAQGAATGRSIFDSHEEGVRFDRLVVRARHGEVVVSVLFNRRPVPKEAA